MKKSTSVLLLILVSLFTIGCSDGSKAVPIGSAVIITFKAGFTNVVTSDGKVVVLNNNLTKLIEKGDKLYLLTKNREQYVYSNRYTSTYWEVVRTFNERK